ncbi:hypothetical protein DYBT9623_04872 [Dyadobacter sp. CECT 9623]|uniref:Uncharacterized protein n=1 Tax=Dyadobacter linearis TaxID=2823330 RepID=A0ABM8UWX3_9BACT|nr:hypothetical protein DYBT9623_04872 [Dyadobacter sp. CECT 9623]
MISTGGYKIKMILIEYFDIQTKKWELGVVLRNF